jgi:uncharacterized OB-fold protein
MTDDGMSAAPGTEGWFRDGSGPEGGPGLESTEGFALLASRCTTCGALSFPPRRVPGCPDPDCDGLEGEPAALSTVGTLWSYTDARYAPPPPYPRPPDTEFTPYTLAAVELAAEKMIVLGQVVPGVDAAALRVGEPMELVAGTLTSSDGVPERVWHWKPSSAAARQEAGA